jgi:hypothetical protein
VAIPTETLEAWRAQLACAFPLVQAVFAEAMEEATQILSTEGLHAYVNCASRLGRMGRGPEPVLAFLQGWPQVALKVGEGLLEDTEALLQSMQKSPNSAAMAPLLNTLPAVARRLQGPTPMRAYLHLIREVMARTTVSIHGRHSTYASPGLPVLLTHAPRVLGALTVAGLARWADYGVRHYQHHPERQRDYFALNCADSKAVLLRERHGTRLTDVERSLELTLQALWQQKAPLRAYTTGLDDGPTLAPWSSHNTSDDSISLPDVYDDLDTNGASRPAPGLDRYRLALAHVAAHRRWSRPLLADNLSPLQRMTIECLEDARVDHLLLRHLPGLRPALLALHPHPPASPDTDIRISQLRLRLTMLSRALLDPAHGYQDTALLDCVAAFHVLMQEGEASTQAIQALALTHASRTRRQSDQAARVYFENTVVTYRDDNRHLWQFIEAGDEEDSFAEPPSPHEASRAGLPPRHYPEWDSASQSLRPDWVSLYESLHPSGDAGRIDALLQQHAPLARQLQEMLDRLKPQNRERIRHQQEGSELDLDVALRSLIDWRAGAQPDPRILMSHRHKDRSIAVLVLLDLSESLNDDVPGTGQTRLALSLQAVAVLAWAMDRLGDAFALAGFNSNTRHDVRYQHLKGFGEPWNERTKARLAALQARYSTRMGAALRHTVHSLDAQTSDKKLVLVLTDGRPSDVDVVDEQLLVADTRHAVQTLAQKGILSHCISLDPMADTYVHDIFGKHATVVDRLEQLPERLTRLFVNLTR